MRKNLNFGSSLENGWYSANRCFFYHAKEESINHLLVHCVKTRVLWELMFALFRVSWVLPVSVRETLLGWHGPFEDKKRRKVWKAGPLCLFWIVWKVKNRIAFEEEELSIQRLKSLFVSYLWSEAKGYLDDVPLTLFSFLDWLGHW